MVERQELNFSCGPRVFAFINVSAKRGIGWQLAGSEGVFSNEGYKRNKEYTALGGTMTACSTWANP